MCDPKDDREPATPEQLQRLRVLGLDFTRPIGKNLADWHIKHWSATKKQKECLAKFGHNPTATPGKSEAQRLIGEEVAKRRRLPPTPKQQRFLSDRGLWREGMTRGEAFDLIGKILGR